MIVHALSAGFSSDVNILDECDIRTKRQIFEEIRLLKNKEKAGRIASSIRLADGVRCAIISLISKKHKNEYSNWRRSQVRLYKKLAGIKSRNVWKIAKNLKLRS